MKLAVFYHGLLQAPGYNMGDMALTVLMEQMHALKESGLAEAATELHLGINDSDLCMLACLAPPKSILHRTGDGSQGEKPTLTLLQNWLPGHEDWFVCYHHAKGCTNGKHVARHCMENAVIWNWRNCINDLVSGYDAVGCHWMDYRRQPVPPEHKFFGGTFWWSKQSYLKRLPPLRPAVHPSGRYFEGEIWIGRIAGEPRVKDYHQPGCPCAL